VAAAADGGSEWAHAARRCALAVSSIASCDFTGAPTGPRRKVEVHLDGRQAAVQQQHLVVNRVQRGLQLCLQAANGRAELVQHAAQLAFCREGEGKV
jgi:hypothetical protein